MESYSADAIISPVKLVIWDLDETFWKGTLSEGGITPVARNIEIVRTLVDRGIMCSICSKNDFDTAKAKLQELGIWDYFVFPHIDWSPKGQAITTILGHMGLRAENTVFLDDNHMNLEEAAFFNEGMACVDGTGDMTVLLDSPQLQGKDDRAHSRLKQYRVMEEKRDDQTAGGLSNMDFLRQSDIKIRIITDIDDKMDRILELINRTNQLNFTKTRANTDKEKAVLHTLLETSGMHAGLVEVRDRYGDYGIVGFFCVRTKFSGTIVHHFTFSCRTLNMGVEQWVWAYLGKPEFTIEGPVAGKLDPDEQIDWITEVTDFETGENALEDKRLCLVGGCDLLQVSFYCGTNRDEFVNKQDDRGLLVRYDDVGFFLNSRNQWLKHATPVKLFTGWNYDDMLALDASLSQSDLILLSMYFSIPTDNLFAFGPSEEEVNGQYLATIPPRRLKNLMKDPKEALRFCKEMYHRRMDISARLELTARCFAKAYENKRDDAPLFILSAATQHGEQAKRTLELRQSFNAMCRDFCANFESAFFVDVDTLLEPEEFADSDHYTRTGYFKIAQFVNTETDKFRAAQKGITAAPARPKKVVASPKAIPQAPSDEVLNRQNPASSVSAAGTAAPRESVGDGDAYPEAPQTASTGNPEWDEETLMRYMGFLSVEWPKLAAKALVSPDAPPTQRSQVLDHIVGMNGDKPGLHLEFGVWRGNSIKRCAKRFPDTHWYGFDSFEGFPDDGRLDWQKPFKVIELPDTPANVTLVKGYFSDTLDPFLRENPGEIIFINVDCDIYSSTVDIFNTLEAHGRVKPGLAIYFDELVNYADYMWNEAIALFEMLERTGLSVEWVACDQHLRMPEDTIRHFYDGTHTTWMEDMRSGYWMQASCILTEGRMDCGPMHDHAWRDKLEWMVKGFRQYEDARAEAYAARQGRLEEMEEERARRYKVRKALEKERQLVNLAQRKAEQEKKGTQGGI